MRETKFRGRRINSGEWMYGSLIKSLRDERCKITDGFFTVGEEEQQFAFEVDPETVGEYTGLKDKNGKEIYEGDVLRVRRPGRDQQTHCGDNIPLGSYTEPLEAIIHEYETEVKFADGIFGCEVEDTEHVPLLWALSDCQAKDEQQLKEMFGGGWGNRIFEGWEDDKECLFEQHGLASVEELMNYIGVEIIGNIYEHPHLLKGDEAHAQTT